MNIKLSKSLYKETMDILGITHDNKDVDMILIIGKEGMDYFFNRLDKIPKKEYEKELYYFKQYFNMYLFDSDIWDITIDEQFEILSKHTLTRSNICSILDLLHEENIAIFWENLLYVLDLIKMNEFLEVTNAHDYYINHIFWNNDNPINTLLFKKLSNSNDHINSAYEIIFKLLKNKDTKKNVVNWIIDLCENANIPSEPVLSFENILDILQFSKVNASNEQEKYNKNTLVYFNILKIILKLFINGIKTSKDVVKININYLEDDNEEDYNFLTTLYFNLQTLLEKCYLFKFNELKQRENYIDEIENEIEIIERMTRQDTTLILKNLKDSIALEQERIYFLKSEITHKNNSKISVFYYICAYWINLNANNIKTNSANNIISNILQFFLEESVNEGEIDVINNYYSCDDIFMMCMKIIENQKITSDPSHKIDSIYIYNKNMHLPSPYKTHNFISFFSQYRLEIFNAHINTCIFLKDKLDDYGESFKLHIYNCIITIINFANLQFNINNIENKVKAEKFSSIILEITNTSFEYWINNIKIIKKIQDEDKEKDLNPNEINQFKSRLQKSEKYLQINLNYISILSSYNFDIMNSSIIVKHFSNSVCYMLDTLVGNNKKSLSIKNKETYSFYPLNFLKTIIEIIQKFASSKIFIDVIGRNFTYDSPKLIKKVIEILSKKGELYQISEEILNQFQSKIHNIKELELVRDEIEIPDEFCDPIMQTLIETPIILPNTDIYMDREVISRHLLTEETNPFNRESLNMKILDEFNSQESIKSKLSVFKQKIEKWKKEINF